MNKKRKVLRKEAAKLKPSMMIGKSQLSEGVIVELDRILEANEMAKVRFLRSSDPAQRDQMVSRLVRETRAELVETRGNTITLFRARGDTAEKIYKLK